MHLLGEKIIIISTSASPSRKTGINEQNCFSQTWHFTLTFQRFFWKVKKKWFVHQLRVPAFNYGYWEGRKPPTVEIPFVLFGQVWSQNSFSASSSQAKHLQLKMSKWAQLTLLIIKQMQRPPQACAYNHYFPLHSPPMKEESFPMS